MTNFASFLSQGTDFQKTGLVSKPKGIISGGDIPCFGSLLNTGIRLGCEAAAAVLESTKKGLTVGNRTATLPFVKG